MTDLAPLQYPKQFRGLFAQVRDGYQPLIEDARRQMAQLPIPKELRPYLRYVVNDNPQPSFMLFPLLFLATADATGGVRQKHRDMLPVLMLAMEIVAVADDSVDRTPMRSDRLTFPARFGVTSSVPFAGALAMLVAQHSSDVDTRGFHVLTDFFVKLFSNELWESQHLYPPPADFDRWLDCRYGQSTAGAACVFNLSLVLSDHLPISLDACEAFGRVFQDVDDIVNIMEDRESSGENDDIMMGMVTYPLLYTLHQRIELHSTLHDLWTRGSIHEHASSAMAANDQAHCDRRRMYAPLRNAIVEIGVPETAKRVLQNCAEVVASSPPSLRGIMRAMVGSFADRLVRCGSGGVLTTEQIADALREPAVAVGA